MSMLEQIQSFFLNAFLKLIRRTNSHKLGQSVDI